MCSMNIINLGIDNKNQSKNRVSKMLVDILFVVLVIGILVALYKTKFSQTKTT